MSRAIDTGATILRGLRDGRVRQEKRCNQRQTREFSENAIRQYESPGGSSYASLFVWTTKPGRTRESK
jgi:hypothetical protein